MRLVTRGDFDGLVCSALLKEIGVIDAIHFVHPKDVQDGKITVEEDDVLANVPYMKGAGMWFDHHVSESVRLKEEGIDLAGVRGAVRKSPSAARVVWDYYGGPAAFPKRFEPMMEGVDKVDSANLGTKDILKPAGWILLGYLVDPRTGMGRYKFAKDNWVLLQELTDMCRTMPIKEILAHPDVKERVDRYYEQIEPFKEMLLKHSRQEGKVVVTDLRELDEILVGNRFMIYALFPECQTSVQLMWGFKKENVVATVGHSIVNRHSKVNVGTLLLEYKGGGHAAVGTCQLDTDVADEKVAEIVERLNEG